MREERLETFVGRCDVLGMGMSERIASGDVAITQVAPGEMRHTHTRERLGRTTSHLARDGSIAKNPLRGEKTG